MGLEDREPDAVTDADEGPVSALEAMTGVGIEVRFVESEGELDGGEEERERDDAEQGAAIVAEAAERLHDGVRPV